MSLLKWTLATAGTAMAVRYLSDRRRRRVAGSSDLAPRTDRDGAGYSADDSGLPGMGTEVSTGSIGSCSGSSSGSSSGIDSDPLSSSADPGHTGTSSNRF